MNKCKCIFLFASMLLMLLSGCALGTKPTVEWYPAKTTHTLAANPYFEILWERPIYTEVATFGNPCAVIGGSFFVAGSEQAKGDANMIAINGKEGTTQWSKESGIVFSTSKTALFIGEGETIVSLSPKDGSMNWKTSLLGARSIRSLFYFDEKIFVYATGFPFFVVSPSDGSVIATRLSHEGFQQNYPKVPFYPELDFKPIIIDDDVILNEGRIIYSIVRRNTATQRRIWEIETDSISNSALIGDALFYISKDDKLKAVSASTGEAIYEALIQPSIGFFDVDKDSQHDGYYLCSDEANRILFVILGDSRQLLALSVK